MNEGFESRPPEAAEQKKNSAEDSYLTSANPWLKCDHIGDDMMCLKKQTKKTRKKIKV